MFSGAGFPDEAVDFAFAYLQGHSVNYLRV
ncbi:hypothetical protein AHiyo6_05990 [Arthrobacter sp. Hiyo6]|nr:hypothetical protein AHiyo6_05990 [Arthrobacter sp. Hiyo6]